MKFARVVPGIALCSIVGVCAWALAGVERRVFGQSWIEPLVLAILIGALVRTGWTPGVRWQPGIEASARQLLETAVVLLGASVDVPLLLRAGPSLALGIVLVVAIGISISYGLSRALGLNRKLSMLVACGNSICGNSAIAAVAPVIDADPSDIASSIAFTAVLGVVAVLLLPALGRVLGYSQFQFGVLAGLSVYAVPQVLAVTLSVSPVSAEIGTLVKLVRVLMLGPVIVVLSLARHRGRNAGAPVSLPPLSRLVPWFIVGFLGLAALRSAGMIGAPVVPVLRTCATVLTVLAMAALGLGVDVRVMRKVGASVTAAVSGSLAALVLVSIGLIALLRLV
jgi:uncharacterized integral membrane protein (TIGR00698 family)